MISSSSSSPSIGPERMEGNGAAAALEHESMMEENNPAQAPSRVRNKNHARTSVIVIGAGMSGMACACELQHRGYNVLVVEARKRAGGRLNGSSIRIRPWQQPSDDEQALSSDQEDPDDAYTNIDLGGALIHGVLENPVASLVEEMGLPVQPVSECLLLSSSGWPVDPREDDKVSLLFNECLDIAFAKITEQADGYANPSNTDTFGETFRAVCEEKNVPQSTLLQWHQANLEVSCGASFDQLGHTWNEDEPYGFDGDHVAIQQSWKAVTDAMAEGLEVLYDAPVERIQVLHPPETDEGPALPKKPSSQSTQIKRDKTLRVAVSSQRERPTTKPVNPPSRLSQRIRGVAAGTRRSDRSRVTVDRLTIDQSKEQPQRASTPSKTAAAKDNGGTMVRVTLQNGTVLEAHAIICTLPLGILKSPSITFDPPLPVNKQHAIERLGVGLLNKCVLSFSRCFWQDSDFLGLAAKERAYLVLNGHKYTGKPILIFMYGGDFAKEIQDWTDEEIVDDCLQRLKTMCGSKIAPVLDYRVTRWGKEQYSMMSFSYVPPGVDGPSEYQAMSEPILNHDATLPVLMFAGEHTTPYHPSTIHGAFLSGIREAYRLDCALFPEANNNLTFNDEDLYERTFPMTRKASDDLSEAPTATRVATEPALSSSMLRTSRLHRRRGAATTVNQTSDAVSVPRTADERGGTASSDETNGAPLSASRRSQRGSTTPVGSSTGTYSRSDEEMEALEDEQIRRGVESYGRDYAYLHSQVLPVHGVPSRWSLTDVKKRVQSLIGRMKKRKPPSSSVWKRFIAKDGSKGKTSATHTTIPAPKSHIVRAATKSAVTAKKSFAEAVPAQKKHQQWTVTKSGRKVQMIVPTVAPTKRPNGIKTRSGRKIKKPRTL